MITRFAKSYVDRLFTERDILGLYHFFSVLGEQHQLPEECWLFCRLLEWTGSTRSGVWQYYDTISADTFERVILELERFRLSDIAEKYRSGSNISEETSKLDKWIDAHEAEIYNAALKLIEPRKEELIYET